VNRAEMSGFRDELLKLAYKPSTHAELASLATDGMGMKVSPGVRKTIIDGAKATDYGVRFPIFPWTDELHSFPTQTKKKIFDNVKRRREQGVKDVALSIAKGGLMENARAVRGLRNIGEGSHMVADFSAHYEKPSEMKAAIPFARKALRALPDAYGGGVESLFEHLRTGYELDNFDPKNHGMDKAEASLKAKKFMQGFNPTAAGTVIGETTRTGAYVAEQAVRAGKAIGKAYGHTFHGPSGPRLRRKDLAKVEASVDRARANG
jgi:hypothetical protein